MNAAIEGAHAFEAAPTWTVGQPVARFPQRWKKLKNDFIEALRFPQEPGSNDPSYLSKARDEAQAASRTQALLEIDAVADFSRYRGVTVEDKAEVFYLISLGYEPPGRGGRHSTLDQDSMVTIMEFLAPEGPPPPPAAEDDEEDEL